MNDSFSKKVNINSVGKFTGQTYLGEFTLKVSLSPMDLINADRTYRELLGGNPMLATNEAQQMAYALSQLKYRIQKYPAWWEEVARTDSNFFDYSIIIDVLNKALEVEEEFRAEVDERLKAAQEKIGKAIRKKVSEPVEEEEETEDEE